MSSLTRRSFLRASAGALSASLLLESSLMAGEPIQPDHVLLGCKNLDQGIAYAEKLCGYRAAIGGSHPGRGTRNAILKMGERSYLEIIAPDPDQPQLTWHQELLTLDEPLLVGWAVAVKDIDGYATRLRAKGVACIGPTPGNPHHTKRSNIQVEDLTSGRRQIRNTPVPHRVGRRLCASRNRRSWWLRIQPHVPHRPSD